MFGFRPTPHTTTDTQVYLSQQTELSSVAHIRYLESGLDLELFYCLTVNIVILETFCNSRRGQNKVTLWASETVETS